MALLDETALKEAVLRSVAERRPLDPREDASRALILEGLQTLERPFDRHADPVHVTGSAVVVGPRGVLLHRHKRLSIWLQPGGHIDGNEAPWDAALREAEEETGLHFQGWREPPALLHVDVHPGGSGHTHLDLRYLLSVDGDDEPAPGPQESQEVRWFGWEKALSVADAGLRALLEALHPGAQRDGGEYPKPRP
ncbi:MAG: NUDIX hydrolase [Acidimicrobiales bacterium]